LGVHRVKRVDSFEIIPLSFMPNVASPDAARDEQRYLALLTQALNERKSPHSHLLFPTILPFIYSSLFFL
jgi:hypothetical protein